MFFGATETTCLQVMCVITNILNGDPRVRLSNYPSKTVVKKLKKNQTYLTSTTNSSFLPANWKGWIIKTISYRLQVLRTRATQLLLTAHYFQKWMGLDNKLFVRSILAFPCVIPWSPQFSSFPGLFFDLFSFFPLFPTGWFKIVD